MREASNGKHVFFLISCTRPISHLAEETTLVHQPVAKHSADIPSPNPTILKHNTKCAFFQE